ncbi:peptidoglycan editing factor PgeF [Wenzhouxiangella marina]|uniref:Purine nucleoside phosphorylase n=1 Tax=Wenzhouxiangella marina TaxID=1579979 RepID=A0A0K0XT05_9GAMM|nr:peptidoglycan editing factor PgeF [Wenzhouxiangella marina]AKS40790.1 Multi-copper polyphenol oxidoreductase, laccase [Wenzhouxiangella marina]MBB6087663.1 hypothetical protein [Wenzhouxiangella marina]
MKRFGVEVLVPEWAAPSGVSALATTRSGGVSRGPWASFNLGLHCGDDPDAVAENRRRLGEGLPESPRWLQQVHGSGLIHLDDWRAGIEADAAWTDRPGQVCAILTADCLPILLCDREARLVAAVHAGWRGLAAGILDRVVEQLPVPGEALLAWIGPGISAAAYEVDDRLRQTFIELDASLAAAFQSSRQGHWLADLKAIATHQLHQAGVLEISDAKLCTASDSERFFSHRRDQGRSGRQASLIWLDESTEA